MPVKNYLTLKKEIISQDASGAIQDYVPDPLGSTAKMVDTSHVITSGAWWPYGEAMPGSSLNTNFGFVGTYGYYQSASSPIYIRARFLSAQFASWLSQDPVWPFLKNAYVYANSNPATRIDPTGYLTILDTLAAAGVGCLVGGVTGGIIGYLTGGSCQGLCSAALGCIVGGIAGAITSIFPEAAGGCLGGAASGLGSLGAGQLCNSLCKCSGNNTNTGELIACGIFFTAVSTVLGCLAGAGIGSNILESIYTNLIGSALGSLCTTAGLLNPPPTHMPG